MRITIDEYFKILSDAWERSPYFSGWDQEWHPEDLFNNFDSVARGVGEGLVAYTSIVGQHIRKNKTVSNAYSSDKKTVDDMLIQESKANPERIQVFGGNLPRGEWDNYEPTYTGNSPNVFGDNV